ncbi:MFS transporter [Alteromonas facilis]|uniref:MFS transporter n=1 Tax=Alteromonas facilis TaxID=2048004 RepID=UPI000C290987|nr:MFS transporter [Alteromonas facilis]
MKRLSLTYFLYFAQLGIIVPYLGIFLDGRGFSSAQIGELFALITFARIFGPGIWASLADKTGKTLFVLRLGCLLTVISFAGVFWAMTFWWLTLTFGLMMMFWTAVLPQLEVITLTESRERSVNYGNVRLWGSIGFILLTMLTGHLLDVFGSEVPIYISVTVLGLLFLSTLWIANPRLKQTETNHNQGGWQLVFKPVFLIFLLSATLLQVSFGPYYGFFALYMRDLGHSGQFTGFLIALGVAAEVIIFMLAHRLLQRFGVKWLLIVSILLTAIRWWVLGFLAHANEMLIVSQLLHAFSFGLTHAVSVAFIHHYFHADFQSRGQAIYIGVAFGAGGALGNWLAGQMWSQGSGSLESFTFAAIIALVSALILLPLSKQKLA